ncbi:F-box/FBD/LRR protein [Rhynchospora pubera]|uniref:F-box/FBD/LRR protein n=1 Tax=Rhynchospora pubera TaxID=906938 RepID=A0AAV8EM22_9POAL|nr:F-box/FBD/LRR protein [Rhynchospora pubera]
MEVKIVDEKKLRAENSDRISNLPDSLLIEILSWLDAWEAVQTCILSKRWRSLWTFVPYLYFDFDDFGDDTECFNNFVSSFLRLRDDATNVCTFTLKYSVPDDAEISGLINLWILYALNHKVKNLEVDLFGKRCGCLTDCLFTCASLKYLHLNCYYEIQPNIVCLPKLRFLSLYGVFMPNVSIEKIISGCPSLKTLSMHRCFIATMNGISFQTIKSLTIEKCDFYSRYDLPNFDISAPCLKYIKFVKGWGPSVTFKDMSKLTQAMLIMTMNSENDTDCHFLSGMLGVETLAIGSIHLKELLTGELKNCRQLQKLKSILLGVCCMHCDFGTCAMLLKYCPNLEHLCLMHSVKFCRVDHSGEVTLENLEEIEGSSCRNLKSIEIVWYQSHHSVQQLQQLLLHWTKKIHGVQIKSSEIMFESLLRP